MKQSSLVDVDANESADPDRRHNRRGVRDARPRILLVEQFFYPEGWGGAELSRDVSTHFSRIGFHVEVICGADQYVSVEGDDGRDPRREGVTIRRVPRLAIRGDGAGRKLLRQLWFYVWLLPRLLFARPPDVFSSQTNPPFVVPLVALAARLWRKPYFLIAMDLYPEVLVAHGVLGPSGVIKRTIGAIFDWSYRSACKVVALGPVMAARIRAKGVAEDRVVEIGNWATGAGGVIRGEANALRSEMGLQDNFILLYSGNLGLGHEFESLVRGFAAAHRQLPSIRLVFVGQGTRLEEVKILVRELGLESSVRFLPYAPSSRLAESIGLADLGVVTLRNEFDGLIVPSKLLGYMARGVPLLYVGPAGDVDLLVSRSNCGLVVRNGDPDAVAMAIMWAYDNRGRLEEMGRSGRLAYERDLTREKALSKYEAAVLGCLSRSQE